MDGRDTERLQVFADKTPELSSDLAARDVLGCVCSLLNHKKHKPDEPDIDVALNNYGINTERDEEIVRQYIVDHMVRIGTYSAPVRNGIDDYFQRLWDVISYNIQTNRLVEGFDEKDDEAAVYAAGKSFHENESSFHSIFVRKGSQLLDDDPTDWETLFTLVQTRITEQKPVLESIHSDQGSDYYLGVEIGRCEARLLINLLNNGIMTDKHDDLI